MLYRTQGLHAERGCAGIYTAQVVASQLMFHMRGCFVLLWFRAKEEIVRS